MDIYVTNQEGGMRESAKTGVYPNYLVFDIPSHNRSWWVKLKSMPQEGSLK